LTRAGGGPLGWLTRMHGHSALAVRAGALALLLPFAGGGALAACGDDSVPLAPSEAGVHDATVEASADAELDGAAEASCAVDPGPLDPNEGDAGLQIIGTHRCKDCHGDQLSGNQDGVPSMTAEGGFAYPPNLTPDPATGLGCWTNAQIENAILNGIDNEGMLLCSPMPVFGHLPQDAGGLTPAEVAEVVQYLRSIPAIKETVMNTPACPVPPPIDASADAGIDAPIDAPLDVSADTTSEAETSSEAGDAGQDAQAQQDATGLGDGAPASDAPTEGVDAAVDAGSDN